MRVFFALSIIFITNSVTSQEVSEHEIKRVFEETLQISRNAVTNATNWWRYDNSNMDYFERDTLKLNSSRSDKKSYCKEIYWSFYEVNKCIITTVTECTEPPTSQIPREEDFVTLEIIEKENGTYIYLNNSGGLRDRFKVLSLIKNETEKSSIEQFDYDLELLRLR